MKRLLCFFFSFSLAWTLAQASEGFNDQMAITDVEATLLIERQMENKASQEASRRAELEAMPVTKHHVVEKDGRRVTMNRVEPPAVKVAPQPIADTTSSTSKQLTPAEFMALIASKPEHQTISISVTVFDEGFSKIRWRQPQNNGEKRRAPKEFELWTNIDLNYLRPIHSFEQDDVVYNYFGFMHTITREAESRRRVLASEHGFDYESRWQTPPVDFTTGVPEYVVVDHDSRPIPDELYQQMDALFAHYLENEASYKAQHLRSEALRKAKNAYLEENPPEPKDVIINYWPVTKEGEQ